MLWKANNGTFSVLVFIRQSLALCLWMVRFERYQRRTIGFGRNSALNEPAAQLRYTALACSPCFPYDLDILPRQLCNLASLP